jgi:hypothetical protein
LWHSANLRRYAAEGLAVTGIGCAGVALWLYMRRDDRTAVAPVVGTDHVAVSVIGTFR